MLYCMFTTHNNTFKKSILKCVYIQIIYVSDTYEFQLYWEQEYENIFIKNSAVQKK